MYLNKWIAIAGYAPLGTVRVGRTHAVVDVHAGKEYGSPAKTGYPSLSERPPAQLVPLTVVGMRFPAASVVTNELARSDRLPDWSSTEGTGIWPVSRPWVDRVPW